MAERRPLLGEEVRRYGDEEEKHVKFTVVSDEDDDRIEVLRGDVEAVREAMASSVESAVRRGERMDSLLSKTEALSEQSVHFRQRGRQLHQRAWRQNMLCKVALAIGLVIFVYLMVAAVCGPALQQCI